MTGVMGGIVQHVGLGKPDQEHQGSAHRENDSAGCLDANGGAAGRGNAGKMGRSIQFRHVKPPDRPPGGVKLIGRQVSWLAGRCFRAPFPEQSRLVRCVPVVMCRKLAAYSCGGSSGLSA